MLAHHTPASLKIWFTCEPSISAVLLPPSGPSRGTTSTYFSSSGDSEYICVVHLPPLRSSPRACPRFEHVHVDFYSWTRCILFTGDSTFNSERVQDAFRTHSERIHEKIFMWKVECLFIMVRTKIFENSDENLNYWHSQRWRQPNRSIQNFREALKELGLLSSRGSPFWSSFPPHYYVYRIGVSIRNPPECKDRTTLQHILCWLVTIVMQCFLVSSFKHWSTTPFSSAVKWSSEGGTAVQFHAGLSLPTS